MSEEKKYKQYKWGTLIAFALMYNMVYLGRFNLNNMMPQFADELSLHDIQQTIISLSLFLSYAAGCLVNGSLVDRYGGKRFVLLGVGVSIFCNVAITVVHRWYLLLLLWIVNGYFQSMIWIGGTVLLVKWWGARERGKGMGIANFFSGLSHVTAYVFPAALLTLWPHMDWKHSILIPMGVLGVFAIVFYMAAVESPEVKGLAPYEVEKRIALREQRLKAMAAGHKSPYAYLFKRKQFWWWCAVAMFSSICRYGLLTWIPEYYKMESGHIISETFSNITLPLGMAVGTLTLSWIAGTKMYKNKGLVIVLAAALCGMLTVIFPMIHETQSVTTGIFFTGFFLYGINGVLWLYAMDEGGRAFSGTAVGILNCFAYLGASMEPFIFPWVIRVTGDILSIFMVMEMFCIAMVVCGMVVCKKNTAIEPEVRE